MKMKHKQVCLHTFIITIMKRFFNYTFFCTVFFVWIQISHSGCANIIPPSGGVKDTIPPKLMMSSPKDSSINVIQNKIILTFNEFVEVKDVFQNVVINPLPKNNPLIEYKLKNVTIKLKDSLQPNTTYSINFGNSIKDINEGNEAKNFTYIFATGKVLDTLTLAGKVMRAEDGKTDSTLIAVLYNNTADTAVYKLKPRYITKINGNGSFIFHHLPKGQFNLFAMPNDYSKKYDDSTKLFAFADTQVTITNNNKPITLFAFEEAKKKATSTSNSFNNDDKEKKFRYQFELLNGKQDILNDTFTLQFNKKIKTLDTTKIILCDTLLKKMTRYFFVVDSNKKTVHIVHQWQPQKPYRLIVPKDAIIDTANNVLFKTDTIRFVTKALEEYGSIKINFSSIENLRNPVLQILKNNLLVQSIPITQKTITQKLFLPGEYDIRVLYDTNNNGIWDTGNFKQKKQPEIVIAIKEKLSVRSNWDNELDINF